MSKVREVTTGAAFGDLYLVPCRLTMSSYEAKVLYRLMVRHNVATEERGVEPLHEVESALEWLLRGEADAKALEDERDAIGSELVAARECVDTMTKALRDLASDYAGTQGWTVGNKHDEWVRRTAREALAQ